MRRKRLLWQIFPAYLLVILISLAAVIFYSSRTLKKFHLEKTAKDLEARGMLLEGRFRGLLSSAQTDGVDSLCKELGGRTGMRVTVILPDGGVIGDSDEDPSRMDNHADRPEIMEAMAGRKGSSIHFSHTLQEDMMYVAIPLREKKRVAGVLRTAVSLEFIDRALWSLYLEVAGSGLVVALLASLVSLVISRRISRPLEEMKRGAERFAEGNLEHQLAVSDSLELGGLAVALNEMAAQLDDRIRTVLGQRNEFEAVLSSMVEGVLAVDTKERLISMNIAAGRWFQTDPVEAVGKSLPAVIRNTGLLRFAEKTLLSDEPVEGDLLLFGEEERSLQAHGATLKDAQGHRIGAVIVLNDITKIRRLEKVRRDFVANVSHELKTPITGIKGAVETLQEGAASAPEDSSRFLAMIARQAGRLNAIIEDLLLLARVEQEGERAQIELSSVSVNPVLDAAVQSCSHLSREKGVPIEVECEDDLRARIDPPLLEQAVVNLIDNAVKYSEPGGVVEVRGIHLDGKVGIRVEDHGIGIEKEHLERVFERFYRVDKARSRKLGGTGLGLAIVKHIVRAHGGTVESKSTPGTGSVFTILLEIE